MGFFLVVQRGRLISPGRSVTRILSLKWNEVISKTPYPGRKNGYYSNMPNLSHIPKAPGVYLMKDSEDTILYVGKSVNLKSRTASYFAKNASLNFGKKQMVKKVDQVDIIETRNETEALILETSLIKKHSPKYNVLMKDDKNLSYICISNDDIPRIYKTRKKGKRGTYFWPYSQYVNITSSLKLLRRVFQLWNHRTFTKPESPCMDSYIGICPGHCTLDAKKVDIYKQHVENFRNFMRGNTSDVLGELEKKMKMCASELEFERAAEIKKQIEDIHWLQIRQSVRDNVSWDLDVFSVLEKYDQYFFSHVQVRDGHIVGVLHSHASAKRASIKESYEHYLVDTILHDDVSRKLVLASKDDVLTKVVKDFFEEQWITHEIPQRGEKVRIVEFSMNNLLNYAYKHQMQVLTQKPLTKKAMTHCLTQLFPERQWKGDIIFECFDISHHAGEHTVASKVVMKNGDTDNAKYRKFKMKTIETGEIDDFKSMHEVITRRTRAWFLGKEPFPTLYVIDGGKWQLSLSLKALEEVCQEFDISYSESMGEEVQVGEDTHVLPLICSLAKREEEVFIPGVAAPSIFEHGTQELRVFQKVRDEAHRFAINFNRSKREKAYVKTVLDEMPWIGPKTRKVLLKQFWSVEGIGKASIDDVEKHVTKRQLEAMREYGVVG